MRVVVSMQLDLVVTVKTRVQQARRVLGMQGRVAGNALRSIPIGLAAVPHWARTLDVSA